ncbi:MAG: hypothetical protein M1820_007021 [Bogoriella megaspora]|nr:MAG: hypothetical protein M1820_007021 [Bogoriella megaspora]
MSTLPRPRVSSKQGKLHLSYDLPRRLNSAKVYPVTARNGSHVVLYGHESGVRILWYGGRPLKQAAEASRSRKQAPPKVNGARSDVVALDSDDDAPERPAKSSKQAHDVAVAEFEQEEAEFDPQHPFPPIIQSFDISFGTEVIDIALPSISIDAPQFLVEKAVFAVSCADCSIRLISVPLTPPSHLAKSQQHIGQEIFTIAGPLNHQETVSALALTWISRRLKSIEGSLQADDPDCYLLLASQSTSFHSKLLVHRIPVYSGKSNTLFTEDLVQPFQTQYLRTPGSRLSWRPPQTAANDYPQLLILNDDSMVKLYGPFLAPSDVAQLPNRTDESTEAQLGAWLATLAAGFKTTQPPGSGPSAANRIPILDTQWVLNGQAILVLLSGGEWGLWSLTNSDGAAPLVGGPTTQFTLRGYLNSPEDLQTHVTSRTKGFAPATPNTRKVRSADFLGITAAKGHSIRGGIQTHQLSTFDGQPDERVVLWYDNRAFAIASMQAFWQRHLKNATGDGHGYASSLPLVTELDLQGERCNGVEQLPGPGFSPTGLPELLIAGERRLMLIVKEQSPESTVDEAPLPASHEIDMADADQVLLENQVLDLGGVNRLLDSMAAGGPEPKPQRRVGFV